METIEKLIFSLGGKQLGDTDSPGKELKRNNDIKISLYRNRFKLIARFFVLFQKLRNQILQKKTKAFYKLIQNCTLLKSSQKKCFKLSNNIKISKNYSTYPEKKYKFGVSSFVYFVFENSENISHIQTLLKNFQTKKKSFFAKKFLFLKNNMKNPRGSQKEIRRTGVSYKDSKFSTRSEGNDDLPDFSARLTVFENNQIWPLEFSLNVINPQPKFDLEPDQVFRDLPLIKDLPRDEKTDLMLQIYRVHGKFNGTPASTMSKAQSKSLASISWMSSDKSITYPLNLNVSNSDKNVKRFRSQYIGNLHANQRISAKNRNQYNISIYKVNKNDKAKNNFKDKRGNSIVCL